MHETLRAKYTGLTEKLSFDINWKKKYTLIEIKSLFKINLKLSSGVKGFFNYCNITINKLIHLYPPPPPIKTPLLKFLQTFNGWFIGVVAYFNN